MNLTVSPEEWRRASMASPSALASAVAEDEPITRSVYARYASTSRECLSLDSTGLADAGRD